MTDSQHTPSGKIPRPTPRGPTRRRDLYLLIGLASAVVIFSAISITINALRPDVPTTSNSASIDPRVQDSDFVLHLGSRMLPSTPQKEAIALGRETCTQFDAGASRDTVITALEGKGLNSIQASAVIDASIEAFCPAHRGVVTG
jgi:hypothetical protein